MREEIFRQPFSFVASLSPLPLFFLFSAPSPSLSFASSSLFFCSHGRPVVVDDGGGHKHVRIQRHGGASQEPEDALGVVHRQVAARRRHCRRSVSFFYCLDRRFPREECGVCFQRDRSRWHGAGWLLPLEVAKRGTNCLARRSRVPFFSFWGQQHRHFFGLMTTLFFFFSSSASAISFFFFYASHCASLSSRLLGSSAPMRAAVLSIVFSASSILE